MTDIYPDERVDRINEHITLIQARDGLTFTTDAYLLSAYIKRPAGVNIRAAELGAGTGVVSLLAASRGKADFFASIEVQERFFDIMKRNIAHNGFDGVIEPVLADVRSINGSLCGGGFDYVFSNPPYMTADSGILSESGAMNIARREILGGIDDFCGAAARLCRQGGMFYVVYRPERIADLMVSLRRSGFEPKTLTLLYPTPSGRPSLVLCAARRGGGAGLTVTPPLFAYKEESGREETENFKYIYENDDFPQEYRQ
ncbi:MAG: RsmD family RNA methyltransferase [Firmicutes bacterium]|nr:RsmD family RNA methyltransferase [Bacillota bacterium]